VSDDTKELKGKIKELENELALKNGEIARYRKELQRTNSRLEKMVVDLAQELKLAGLIQKVLSPTEIPNIPGVEFSTKFLPGVSSGGDYFDIFEHDDRMKFGIILSSSSGYTMSALFLSVLIKLAAQIEARKGVSPDRVVQMIADELIPNVQNNDSLSIFYAVFDRRSYELSYCSVGNILGLWLPYGESKVVSLEASGGPVRKGYAQLPLSQTLQLNARDRLILCSEGVWEAKNAEGQSVGRENILRAVLSAPRSGVHEVRNEILYQVEKLTEQKEPQRDQTVVVTEVKDRVIKLAKKSSV
jgi:sigma-B regulation protein RsbU (phosphoserine phosphatase)